MIISCIAITEKGIGRLGLFCAGLFAMLVPLTMILMVCSLFPKEVNRVDYKRELFSLKMESSLSGSFFVGTGSFDGVQKYYYYLEDKDGFFSLQSSPTYNVRIKEQDGTPYIFYQVVEQRPSSLLVPSFVPSFFKKTSIDMFIPQGSIITKFDPN